jgi:hypothetical protein
VRQQANFESLRLLRVVGESPAGPLEFRFNDKAVSKRGLARRLRKLENLGWVTHISGDRWSVSHSGKEKLVEFDDWEWNVGNVFALAGLSETIEGDILTRSVVHSAAPSLS